MRLPYVFTGTWLSGSTRGADGAAGSDAAGLAIFFFSRVGRMITASKPRAARPRPSQSHRLLSSDLG